MNLLNTILETTEHEKHKIQHQQNKNKKNGVIMLLASMHTSASIHYIHTPRQLEIKFVNEI